MVEKKPAKLTRSPSGARLKPTNLPGVYSFESTPPDLKRQKAGVKTLKRHGLPVRPRGKGSETAAHLWDSMMSRRFRHIHPHLRVTSTLNPPPGAGAPANSDFGSGNWSGGVVKAPRPKIPPRNLPPTKLVAVYSNWVVPTVRRPEGAADYDSPWASAAWVGLDGYGNALHNGNVVQAGTEHDVDDSDNVYYYAWYEWYPGPSVAIDNFPVAPGDAMFVYVRSEGLIGVLNYGSAWLVNHTRGIETSVFWFGPPTSVITFEGISAECIMERPSQTMPDNKEVPYNFVHYGEIAFTSFGACTDDGTFFSAKDLYTLGQKSGLSDGQHSEDIVCRPPF